MKLTLASKIVALLSTAAGVHAGKTAPPAPVPAGESTADPTADPTASPITPQSPIFPMGYDYTPEDGFVDDEPCMQTRYEVNTPGSELTCDVPNSEGKFWRTINLRAPSSCIEGRRLVIDDLELGVKFKRSWMDFAVSAHVFSVANTHLILHDMVILYNPYLYI